MAELTLCEVCGGYLGAVPELYEGPGIPACFCNRERHIEEELHRAGSPNTDVLSVNVADVTKVISKGPGE